MGPGIARLALVPNLGGNGDVLLLCEVNMVTMEAAEEYAACSDCVAPLLKALGIRRLEDLPYFEAILGTSAVENTPHRAKVITARTQARSGK